MVSKVDFGAWAITAFIAGAVTGGYVEHQYEPVDMWTVGAKTAASTVSLHTKKDGRMLGGGTGIVVGHNLVLTAQHVVDAWERDEYEGVGRGAEERWVSTSTVWEDEETDVALVEMVIPVDVPKIPVTCDAVDIGEEVVFTGNTSADWRRATRVARVMSEFIEGVSKENAPILRNLQIVGGGEGQGVYGGDSGSGVINENGEIVGLVSVGDPRSPWGGVSPSTEWCEEVNKHIDARG